MVYCWYPDCVRLLAEQLRMVAETIPEPGSGRSWCPADVQSMHSVMLLLMWYDTAVYIKLTALDSTS
jgi:hypothetical protein